MILAQLASSHVEARCDFTLAHLSNGRAVVLWALGSMDLKPGPGAEMWHGVSLFDGSATAVEIRPHPELYLIDFHLGPTGARRPRVSTRVVPGDLGLDGQTCLVAMSSWRGGGTTDDRWQRTCATHNLEVRLIKAQVETDWGRR